jgi:Mg2+ and Co2+ transporter CorA
MVSRESDSASQYELSVTILDYSATNLEEHVGAVGTLAFLGADVAAAEKAAGILCSDRPSWANVRWMDLEGDWKGNESALRYLLRKILGPWGADLAYDSITMPRQRVKTHVFRKEGRDGGGVLFVFAKIPSLPAKLSGEINIEALAKHLSSIAHCTDESAVEYERIVFLFDLDQKTATTIQAGKEGDCWGPLRASIRSNSGGHHDVRRRGLHILFWNLLNDALRSCEDIDSSFGFIIDTLLSQFESPTFQPSNLERDIARSLQNDMQKFRRQVLPLRDVFETMAAPTFSEEIIPMTERVYFEDLRDQSLRIIDNIQEHFDNSSRLQMEFDMLEDRKSNNIQFVISIALSIFSPLSWLVGLYGMNFQGKCADGQSPGDNGERCPGGMPELYWEHGYEYIWGLMIGTIVLVFLGYVALGIFPLPRFVKKLGFKSVHGDVSEGGLLADLQSRSLKRVGSFSTAPTRNSFTSGLSESDNGSSSAERRAGPGRNAEPTLDAVVPFSASR